MYPLSDDFRYLTPPPVSRCRISKYPTVHVLKYSTLELINEINRREPESGLKYTVSVERVEDVGVSVAKALYMSRITKSDSANQISQEPRPKRRSINMNAKVMTHAELDTQLQTNTNKVKKIINKAPVVPKKTNSKKKIILEDDETSLSSVESIDMSSGSSEYSSEDFNDHCEDNSEILEKNKGCSSKYIGSSSKEQTKKMPVLTEDSIEKYFAVYYTEPINKYFWGKVIKVFSVEEASPVNQVEFIFMKQKAIGSDPNKWTWVKPTDDKTEIVEAKYVFSGPHSAEALKGDLQFKFPDKEVSEIFKKIVKNL